MANAAQVAWPPSRVTKFERKLGREDAAGGRAEEAANDGAAGLAEITFTVALASRVRASSDKPSTDNVGMLGRCDSRMKTVLQYRERMRLGSCWGRETGRKDSGKKFRLVTRIQHF